MTKKYTSLEHTIRQVHDKKQINEAVPLKVAAAVGKGLLQAGKWSTKAAVAAELLNALSSGNNAPQASSNSPASYRPDPVIQPVGVSVSDTRAKSKSRQRKIKEELQLEQSVEKDRKEVEYVSRPDTAKSPKDKKSKLGKQSAILTRIIDEEKSLVEFFNVTLKKRKERKKKEVETESGKTKVVFNPKLKVAIQEQSKLKTVYDYLTKSSGKKTATAVATGAAGGTAAGVGSTTPETSNIETGLSLAQLASLVPKVARFVPGLQTATGLGIAGARALKGDWKGAGLAAGSAIPGPVGYGFVAADLARNLSSSDPASAAEQDKKPATPATPATSATPAAPSAKPPPAKPPSANTAVPATSATPAAPSAKPPSANTAAPSAPAAKPPLANTAAPSAPAAKPPSANTAAPATNEPEKPSEPAKPQTQPQVSKPQPKPQPKPQVSRPQPSEPKSDWASQELQKAREGRSAVFGQGGYESGGPNKTKAKDHVLKAFMRSRKK